MIASRHDGRMTTNLSLDTASLVCRLNRWQTAAEAGADWKKLCWLVGRDLLFWSEGRPMRDLSGSTLDAPSGALALRRNVSPQHIVLQRGKQSAIPFMPRRGTLADMELHGMEFTVVEMETDTHTVAFGCCARHAHQLRDLLVQLDGRHDAAELLAGEAKDLVTALAKLGLLEHHTPPAPGVGSKVTWLGHAGLLYESGGKRMLIDPVTYAYSQPSRRTVQPPDPRNIGLVDAILITHGDADHLSHRMLSRFPRTTPVFIPRANPQPYQVDMEALLALLGFANITLLDEWQQVDLGGVQIVAAPFYGEDWGLELGCRSYLIKSADLTLYANADCTFMPEVYARLGSEHRIDLACLGVSACQEAHLMTPGYGYGHFYADWIPPENRNQWIQLCSGPNEAAEAARLLGARRVFGYAAGAAGFVPLTYTDRGTHEELAALLATSGAQSLPISLPLGIPIDPRC